MELQNHLKTILTPELCLAVYHLKFPDAKSQQLGGGAIGWYHFRPDYQQRFYDLIFHDALMPMSKIPLESLLAIDLTELLPPPIAPDYPEQCLGMITLLDQTRVLTAGYSFRYTRSFFTLFVKSWLGNSLLCPMIYDLMARKRGFLADTLLTTT